MKITIAQLNPTIGDFEGNLSKIEKTLIKVQNETPDLVIFSELYLTGYPPRDLLERKDFIEKSQEALHKLLKISEKYPRTAILCGNVLPANNKGKGLYNTAFLISRGKTIFHQNKTLLPTYDVFDETRYFDPAPETDVVTFKNEKLGITICEDMWNDPKLWPKMNYPSDPLKKLTEKGATIFINLSASPFHIGKEEIRYRLICRHAAKHKKTFIFVNQIGGNDELIFDGRSMIINREGDIVKLFPSFKEHIQTIDLEHNRKTQTYKPLDKITSVYDALITGIRDYIKKCGFNKAVLGLSGGIDSSLVCCLAAQAIGPENILGVSMPSPYSSKESTEDARQLAENLCIKYKIISIISIFTTYLESLKKHFIGRPEDTTEENIQARIRGNILMALSNKFGSLLLSTGNKSELSVGYCTLYGDMSGGLNVISDVPKTMVYKLAEYINRNTEVIPRRIIEKPPSAELKPDQKDQDTLPPYEILDHILNLYLDQEYSKEEIINKNLDKKTVEWVIRAIEKSEYKRKQAAPGLKVTTKAFGTGRRMPIAAWYE